MVVLLQVNRRNKTTTALQMRNGRFGDKQCEGRF